MAQENVQLLLEEIRNHVKQRQTLPRRLQLALQHQKNKLQDIRDTINFIEKTQVTLQTSNENQPFLCVLVLKFVALDGITNCDISLYRYPWWKDSTGAGTR